MLYKRSYLNNKFRRDDVLRNIDFKGYSTKMEYLLKRAFIYFFRKNAVRS